MGKSIKLSDEAFDALAHAKRKNESFSDVVIHLAAASSPIETFADLEDYLIDLKGPLFSDMAALERIKMRKRRV